LQLGGRTKDKYHANCIIGATGFKPGYGSVATSETVTERARAEVGGEVSGRQIEQLVDELILLVNIITPDPPRLPLPDHVHGLVALNRSPGCMELAKALLGLHASFDRSMILLQDVVSNIGPADVGSGGVGFLRLSLRQSPRHRGGPDQC
jgi:hypothetical protein